MSGSTVIKSNATTADGGGVYLNTGALISKTGGTIYGTDGGGNANQATGDGKAVYSLGTPNKKVNNTLTGALSKTSATDYAGGWDE